jgi:haloacetate dehalogenase
MYATLDQHRATSAWRYFFLIQPADLPERLIGAEVEYYVNWTLDEWAADPKAINVAARAEYVRSFTPQTIQATCEDYRAGATIDLEHDANDRDRKLACPLLVLWSRHGLVATHNVLAVWSHVAPDVRGRGIDCGHFLAEERPAETLTELRHFLLGP